MIWLTDDPNRAPIDRGGKTLWVYSDKWIRPEAERVVPSDAFLANPWNYYDIQKTDKVVIVGITMIITPGNRVKTGPFLNEPWKGQRESVDRCLFIGEPWKAWWHWGCCRAAWDSVYHSFRMENLWNQWLDERRPDPCSLDEITRVGSGLIVTGSHTPRFGGIDIEIIKVADEYAEEYLLEKEKAFEHIPTWRGIVKALSSFAQQVAPSRSVPSPSNLFKCLGKGKPRVVATDFPVDTWLTEHLRYLVDITDGVAERFMQEDLWIR